MGGRVKHSNASSAFHKWKRHTSILRTETVNFIARTKCNITTEIFHVWSHLAHINTEQMTKVQCFLKGFSTKTYTITVPLPVTLDQLRTDVAEKTCIPPEEHRLDPMRNFADPHNAHLLHIPAGTTLHLQGCLKDDSGNQVQKILIYVVDLQEDDIPALILPDETFTALKKLLAERTGIPTFRITLFNSLPKDPHTQIDDDEKIKDNAPTAASKIYGSFTDAPTKCEVHGNTRNPQDLIQKLDATTGKWKWTCQMQCVCTSRPLVSGPSQKSTKSSTPPTMECATPKIPNTGAKTSLHTNPTRATPEATTTRRHQHPTTTTTPPPLARPRTIFAQDDPVLAQYQDGQWYSGEIRGYTTTGHFVLFKGYETEGAYEVSYDQIRPAPSPGQVPATCLTENPPTKCELHHKDRSASNLVQTLDHSTQSTIWRCKPNKQYAGGKAAVSTPDTPPVPSPKAPHPTTHSRRVVVTVETAGMDDPSLDTHRHPTTPIRHQHRRKYATLPI